MISDMLSKAQYKLIRSLHTKKGRERSGKCLVESAKVIEVAGTAMDFTFTSDDSEEFRSLVTTESPQGEAGVAFIPKWSLRELEEHPTIIILDGVQDPGNVGTILRLCLGFDAALILIDSVDVTNPKVIRSSVGAIFQVPWKSISRDDITDVIEKLNRPILRLEKTDAAIEVSEATKEPHILIAGSEGSGIQLGVDGQSIYIKHDEQLESLNVGHAVAITLFQLRNNN